MSDLPTHVYPGPPLAALAHWADQTPDVPAWVAWASEGDGLVWNWNQLARAVGAASQILQSYRLARGDRLVHGWPNGLPWVALDLACQWLGIIHVPIDPRLGSTLVDLARKSVDAAGCLTIDDHAIWTRELRSTRAMDANPTALDWVRSSKVHRTGAVQTILFTSGTSSAPRGVVLTQQQLADNARGKLAAMPQTSRDRRLNVLPMAHAYARTCELTTWLLTGGCMTTVPPDGVAACAADFRPTLLNAVPALWERWCHELASDASRGHPAPVLGGELRMIASGGAGLNPATFDRWAARGLGIHQGYGLTEASPVVCSQAFGQASALHVGAVIQGTEIRIDDDQSLWVRGPGVMAGYWRDSDATAQRLIAGWLATGDLAERLPDGNLAILGRLDDRLVLANGYKLDPHPWEQRWDASGGGCRGILALRDGYPAWFLEGAGTDVAQDTRPGTAEIAAALARLQAPLPASVRPRWAIRCDATWDVAEGLLSLKGAPRRAAIARRFAALPAFRIEG